MTDSRYLPFSSQWYRWCVISDVYLDNVHFVLSPRTGTLTEISDLKAFFEARLLRFFLGFSKRTFIASIPWPVRDPLDIASGADAPTLCLKTAPAHPMMHAVTMALRILPLWLVIELAALFSEKRAEKLPLNDAVARVAAAFGWRSRGNCLPVSICRFWLLRRLGWKPSIQIGVLFPTEEMHAWVCLDGAPVLEDADMVSHYRVAVQYFG